MKNQHIHRQNLIADFRNACPDVFAVRLELGDCRIKISTNDLSVQEALKEYFNDFITDDEHHHIHIFALQTESPALSFPFTEKAPDPGKTKIKEEYADIPGGRIVRKKLTGMVFVFGGGEHAAIGPCRQNINQVVNFVNNRYIERKLCQGGLLAHAAGIIWKNRGLALAGFSGAGKSTLALHLMNRGAIFVSNDRLIVEKQGDQLRMQGVAKMPRINPGTVLNNPNLHAVMTEEDRKRFSQMDPKELWDVEHKYDAPIDTCFGAGRFVLNHPMHGLTILTWRHDIADPPKFRQTDLHRRQYLLQAFMKPVGLFFLPHAGCSVCEPNESNYLELLSKATVWELSGGIDFDYASEVLIAGLEAIPV